MQRVNDLAAAQQHIEEAIRLIRQAVKGTKEEMPAESYIVAQLDNWANGYNLNDTTAIPALIEALAGIE